ncbi:MAG: desulfoferrodoxin [archaeon]
MSEFGRLYRCKICGNIVLVMHAGAGTLVCCGQPMVLIVAKKEEEGKEKHLPIVSESKNNIHAVIGSSPHPMESNHYIEWIEVVTEKSRLIKHLSPGSKPEADFSVNEKIIAVREYCNVHGLWEVTKG